MSLPVVRSHRFHLGPTTATQACLAVLLLSCKREPYKRLDLTVPLAVFPLGPESLSVRWTIAEDGRHVFASLPERDFPDVAPSHPSAILCNPPAQTCRNVFTGTVFDSSPPVSERDHYVAAGEIGLVTLLHPAGQAPVLHAWTGRGRETWSRPCDGCIRVAVDSAEGQVAILSLSADPDEVTLELRGIADGATLWRTSIAVNDADAAYAWPVAFSSDSQYVIVAGRELAQSSHGSSRWARVFDATSGKEAARIDDLKLNPSAQGTWATDFVDGHLWIVEMSATLNREFDKAHNGSVTFDHRDKGAIVSATWTTHLAVYRVGAARPLIDESCGGGDTAGLCSWRAVQPHPDGTAIVAEATRDQVRLVRRKVVPK